MNKLVISIALFALSCSGCTRRVADFTIMSTKNIDLTRGADFKRADVRTEGEDTKHIIIFIPTGEPNAKEAADRAIERIPGAIALLDGVVESEFFYFPYIYGYMTIKVKGTPLIDPLLIKK
jgi:hypothetical protein